MKKFTFTILIINLLLLAAQYMLTSFRATDGQKLADLDAKLHLLTLDNHDLKYRIYQQLSLSNINETAKNQALMPIQTNFLSPIPVAAINTR